MRRLAATSTPRTLTARSSTSIPSPGSGSTSWLGRPMCSPSLPPGCLRTAAAWACAYSIASGSRQWNEQPGSATDLAASAGGVLYLDQGLALNTGTGATMATLRAGSQASALAVGNGRITVVTAPAGQVLKLYGLSVLAGHLTVRPLSGRTGGVGRASVRAWPAVPQDEQPLRCRYPEGRIRSSADGDGSPRSPWSLEGGLWTLTG
jgi:hypothetical protein